MSASNPASSWRRPWRAATDVQIDGNEAFDPSDHGVAVGKDAAIDGAIAHCNHPFGIGRRVIGPQQPLAHVLGHRSRHQQHVGVPGRSHKAQPKSFQVVKRIVQRMDFLTRIIDVP